MATSARPGRREMVPVLLAVAALAGCAGPRTTVILLPDEDGHVGAVVVSSDGASRRIARAYDQVTVSGAASGPSLPAGADKQAVDQSYAELMKAQPSKPRTFMVNFLLDSTIMTEASKAMVPEIIAVAHARRPTEVTIYGHADATGTEAHNDRLSAERARVVADLLRKADPTLEHIEIHACGDRVPLTPTEAHAPEPRNRRAEVVIL